MHSWRRYGIDATVWPPEGRFGRVVLRLPKGRRSLEAMLHVSASRLEPGGEMWVCGANDEGIKSAGKTLSTLFEKVETLDTRRKCRLWRATERTAEIQPLERFLSTAEAEVAGKAIRFQTLPGVFAEGRVDAASQLLMQHFRVSGRVLDFGCGAGALGVFLEHPVVGIDVDAWAVHCAQLNGVDARLSNGWSAVDGTFDHIISNPPFHSGKDTDFRVMQDLITGASERLKRGGTLTLVCPATAPIESALKKSFRKVAQLANDRRSAVWSAS